MRARAARTTRAGFALLTAVVAIVIILVLAVAASSTVAVVADRARVELSARVIAQVLNSSAFSIVAFEADVGEYPGKLSHLRTALVNGDKDICGLDYTAGERNKWVGPYAVRSITTSGMWTGIGTARDSLGKDPAAGMPTFDNPHDLVMTIDDVDEGDARVLNALVDPPDEATPGTLGRVRWGSPNAEGRVVLQFRKTILVC